MRELFKKWLEPPVFPRDVEKTKQGRIINGVQVYFVLGLILTGFLRLAFSHPRVEFFIVILALILVNIFGRILLFRGHIQLASAAMVTSAWILFSAAAMVSGGFNSPLMYVTLAAALVSALLVGPRAGAIFIALSALLGLVFILLEQYGRQVDQIYFFTPALAWILFVLSMAFMYSFITIILRAQNQALAGERRQNEARRRVEIVLRENEARFHMLADHAQDIVYHLEVYPAPVFLYISPSALRLTGYTPDEFYVDPDLWLKLIYAEDQAASETFERFITRPGQPLVLRWVHKDGSLLWVEQQNTPVYDEQDRFIALQGSVRDITARMRAELALRESEQFALATIDALSALICVIDDSGTIVMVNNAWRKSAAQSLGSADSTCVGGNYLSLCETLMEAGDPQAIEYIANLRAVMRGELDEYSAGYPCHASAEKRSFQVRVSRFRHSHLNRIVIAHEDVTERAQAEEALRKSEAHFRALVEHSHDGIIFIDENRRVSYASPSSTRTTGFPAAEVMGSRGANYIHPDDLPRTAEEYTRLLKTPGAAFSLEHRMRHKDGGWIWVETNAFNLIEDPHVRSVILTIRDVNARKMAEERLQQSERKYHELFQANNDGITIFSLKNDPEPIHYVEVNTAAHQMLGYTAEEMLALSPSGIEVDLNEEMIRERRRILSSHDSLRFDTTLRHKDGHLVYVEVTSSLVLYEGSTAVMNIMHDITERKRYEMELQAIATLSAAFRAAASRAEMLPELLEQMVNLLQPDAATIEIIEPSGGIVVEAAAGQWADLVGRKQDAGTGINAVIAQTLQPRVTRDLGKDPRVQPYWDSRELNSSAGVPLVAREELIGFLWAGFKGQVNDSQVRLLCAIGDIAANAIHRATLHEQALQAAEDLSQAYHTTLEAWVRALELRDQETEEHSQRVKTMTLQLARALEVDESEQEHILRGAILHDIGKIGVADAILRKPGALTEEEWEHMHAHPQIAYELLSAIDYLRPALDIPYCHHEKWDGSGYPRGLKGEEIPFAARLFAVVDVWDALCSDRPYRPAWEVEKVRAYMTAQAGQHFDPRIVSVFLTLVA